MHTSPMIKEARRLYQLGFAILLLHPKSKRPIGNAWASGPRKTWKELSAEYKDGMNIGVRLGTPSKLDAGYLGVIDVDIKSTEKKHRKEAIAALRALLESAGESFELPTVLSGRGGGSRHLYFVSPEPFKTWNPAESPDMVKVFMPSKAISKTDREGLSESELEEGYRISRAWEISLYSDGRQVVLPPSIHPDSGKAYEWKVPLEHGLPVIDFGRGPVRNETGDAIDRADSEASVTLKAPREQDDIEFNADETLDVRWLPELDEATRKLITDGMWKGQKVSDRSAFLLPAVTGLISAGLDRDGILTVLTDPTTYLGQCAYDHAQTKSRARAAKWLWNYSVKRVMRERDPRLVFQDLPKERAKPLEGDAAIGAQTDEVRDRPEDRGFYKVGEKGGLNPEYDALLKHFESERPYRMIADMKAVYTFNGTHYVDCTPFEIRAYAEQKFNPKPKETIRSEFYYKILANNVVKQSFFTDTTEGKINFKNGVLDLGHDRSLTPHSADFGFRGVLPYAFDPKAKCPVFEKWIRGVMLEDESLVRILQEFMGYVVRGGEYKYHKALWLGGVGRNGKSTFVDVTKALIGAGNFSVISIKSLMNDKFAGADLDGKIANFSEETSPQELADSGPFKNLTGNGDLFAQKKYGNPYSFRNRAKLIMTYNTIPDLKDLSAGMLSRPIIIPFEKIIGESEQDRDIQKKLLAELPGIFNFALEGWHRLEAQEGFTESERSKLALQRVKEESCDVYQWIEDHVEPLKTYFGDDESEGQMFRPVEIYDYYRNSNRGRPMPKAIDFYRKMNAHPLMQKCKHRLKLGWVYQGIRIR